MSRGLHSDGATRKVVEHLRLAESGARMTREEVAALTGIKVHSVSYTLKRGIDKGELTYTQEGQKRFYHLPIEEAPPPPNDGPLNITTDSAGDLWFTGATISESDGSCLLTPKQLQQLVAFATSAPIARAQGGDA